MKKMFITSFLITITLGIFSVNEYKKSEVKATYVNDLPSYTAAQLKFFDGSVAEKPILLALDGFVYDITPGKEFYQIGGTYHFLAGKDSSNELHIAGGEIIRRKYQVIGIFEP